MTDISEQELNRLLSATVDAVIQAGQIITGYYQDAYSVSNKSPDNPVTEADLAADGSLKEKLGSLLPDAGWLSEETADQPDRLAKSLCWIVDPLDGTKEFIMGIPEFSVSVALVEGGQPLIGVVLNPVTEELFQACRGRGAVLNGQTIRTTGQRIMAQACVEASRSERKRGEFAPFEDQVKVRTMGSIAYKLCRLAAGWSDATWSRGPKNEWDICAGALLVEEAGGRCVDLDNRNLRFNRAFPKANGIIATNGQLHPHIIKLLAPHRATARSD